MVVILVGSAATKAVTNPSEGTGREALQLHRVKITDHFSRMKEYRTIVEQNTPLLASLA